MHTEVRPDAIAIAPREADCPGFSRVSARIGEREKTVLFVLEVTFLSVVFHKLVAPAPVFSVFFKGGSSESRVLDFLDNCVAHRKALVFLSPPLRERVLKLSSRDQARLSWKEWSSSC